MTSDDRQNDPPQPEPDPASTWGSTFTPDSDDLRPFPEVSDEWVDEQIRELIRAAMADHERGKQDGPSPPGPSA